MSFPLFVGMMNGQDAVLLLPLIAWALRCSERGEDFQAGLALSLCAIKPHLLVLVPLALAVQRRWGVLRGGLAGGAVLFALSPEAAAVVAQKVTGMLPDELKFSSAGSWFDGHQSIGLAYLSGALFFVMRTVSRLVDR